MMRFLFSTTEARSHRGRGVKNSVSPCLCGEKYYRWTRCLGCVAMLFLFAGCATVPFDTEPKGDFQGEEPTVVVEKFDGTVGHKFEILESVVFKFFGKEITGLGALSIDPSNTSYALTCMTPTGITVFDVRGTGDEVEALFVPPPMEKHREHFAEAVGRDLRRIYLSWTPAPDASVKHKKHRMVFTEKGEYENVEYTFSGPRKLLTEKRFSKGWRTRCVVRYFEYEEVDGRLYPMGIILHNKQFHYRMVLRVKEVYPIQEGKSCVANETGCSQD